VCALTYPCGFIAFRPRGTGKTTVARQLVSEAADIGFGAMGHGVCLWHVCFDEEMPETFDFEVAESSWKQQRQQVLARVERLMDILKGASEVSSAAQLGFISSTNEIEKAKTHVVLIDDNMFYHSMRREYMRVAREAGAGVAIVVLKIDVEEAVQRNRSRIENGEPGVPEAVIRKMDTIIEWPDPAAHPWERFCMEHSAGNSTDEVWASISAAAASPVPPIEVVDLEQQAKDRELTSSNAVHKIDLACRAATSSIMSEASAEEKKLLGKQLAAAKKALLTVAREDVDRLEEQLLKYAPNNSDLIQKVICYMMQHESTKQK